MPVNENIRQPLGQTEVGADPIENHGRPVSCPRAPLDVSRQRYRKQHCRRRIAQAIEDLRRWGNSLIVTKA